MNLNLTPRQQRIVAAGVTALAAAVIITVVVVLLAYSVKFFQAFDSVFLPLAVAAVMAMVLDPWYQWLRARGLPGVVAVVAVFLSLVLPVAAILTLFGAIIFSQLADLVEQLPALWERITAWVRERQPDISRFFHENSVGAKITEALQSPGGPGGEIAGYIIGNVISAGSGIASAMVSLFSWVILPVYLAFFLMLPKLRPESLTPDKLPFLKEDTARDVIYLFSEFFNLVVLFFRGQLLIALIQGILFAVGFSLVGLEYGAVLGLALGFLNIVPFLGSMLGLAVCLPLGWFQAGGGLDLVLLVIGVFTLVQCIEGYFLTPRIMGDRTGLSPLVIIVAIFFWGTALGGMLGIILAIPLTAFVVVCWRLAREKYMAPLF